MPFYFSYRISFGQYEEGKKQFMLENVFFFLSITVFDRQTNFFSPALILAVCCHDNLSRKEGGES